MKKTLALGMAAAMTATLLAGCGGSSSSAASSAAASTAESTASSTAAASTAESTGSYTDYSAGFPENVTIQIPVYDRGFENWNPTDNYYTRWIQSEFGDKYNVTVKYVAIARSNEVQDFNQMIAAGNAPTIIFHYDMPAAVNYWSEGAEQPIDLDEVAYYAPTYWDNMKDTMHTLIHINEALAGLPVNVKFINFDDVKNGVPDDVDVIINAGRAGSAWSGGDAWQDETLVAALNKWVYNGGVLLGVEEPSAVSGYGDTFRMARILGVDEDTGARVCHGRWPVQEEPVDGLIPDGATLKTHDHLYMTDGSTRVLAEVDGTPAIAAHAFGKGRGVYMAGFEYSPVNARMLLNLLLWAKGLPLNSDWLTTDPETEAAWFPADKTLVVINNSTQKKSTVVKTPDGDIAVDLDGLETKILPQN